MARQCKAYLRGVLLGWETLRKRAAAQIQLKEAQLRAAVHRVLHLQQYDPGNQHYCGSGLHNTSSIQSQQAMHCMQCSLYELFWTTPVQDVSQRALEFQGEQD